MPRISVVMPVYNGEQYLEAALASILEQTFHDFEFIIIDDGSTDRTGRILTAAAKRDNRIKIISRENRGISASLNEGIAAAGAEWIARMDADDIALPNRFAVQIAYLEAHPDCGVLGSHILFTDPEDRPITPMRPPLDHDAIVEQMMRGEGAIPHPTTMFRRKLAEAIGGYDSRFDNAEDIDFFLRLANETRLANIPDILLRYRQHTSSVGATKSQSQADAHFRATSEAALRWNLPAPTPIAVPGHSSASDVHERWAWWALMSQNTETARYYAWKVVWKKPLSRQSWKLLFCVMRGH